MELPRVTLDEFLKFEPCWANSERDAPPKILCAQTGRISKRARDIDVTQDTCQGQTVGSTKR